MDTRSNIIPDQILAFERHPAGAVPGQPPSLARSIVCVQPLLVSGLFPCGPALHYVIPAEAPTHPPPHAEEHIIFCPVGGARVNAV